MTVVGSISTRRNELFLFPDDFDYPMQFIENFTMRWKQSVLTLSINVYVGKNREEA